MTGQSTVLKDAQDYCEKETICTVLVHLPTKTGTDMLLLCLSQILRTLDP